MQERPYILYRSSAGSGKTRTLAREFLLLALRAEPGYLKHILAVTFTNKATQEMKSRIIQYLDDFAKGRENNLTPEMMTALGLTAAELKQKSSLVLASLLHDYSSFSVSTIDSFFQRVIRSFTREAGLLGNFRIEVDYDVIMDEVIGQLIDELGTNEVLTRWMVLFSLDKLREGSNWNPAQQLRTFAAEIHKEQYKEVEDDVLRVTPEEHEAVMASLRREIAAFMTPMQQLGRKGLDALAAHGITADMIAYKKNGTAYTFFEKYVEGEPMKIGQRVADAAGDSNDWFTKSQLNRTKLVALVEADVRPILVQMVRHYEANSFRFYSAKTVLNNYHAYGLLADITRKLQAYKEEHNLMLLSDASKFLHGIIGQSDTPFVYEKVGTRFHHYLIDEFQDTSALQWKNFLPLLREAGDQGQANLIVGDVKQAIYRWRGGDLSLLQEGLQKEFRDSAIDLRHLNRNFRSDGRLVEFNNHFFRAAASAVTTKMDDASPAGVYEDVMQEPTRHLDKGFVHVHFVEGDDEADWQQQVLESIPATLEKLQDNGVPLSEVAILVRRNEEGQKVADYMLRFQHSDKTKKGYNYAVVSNESLRLDKAHSVCLLIATFRYLLSPEDASIRGQLAYEVEKGKEAGALFSDAKGSISMESILPPALVERIPVLKRLSLFELTEELIRLYALTDAKEELAYLQAFQDVILDYSARDKSDVAAFLEWWDIYKEKKSINSSAGIDAANILTIHTAKGLEFRYVIIPFCNWQLSSDFHPALLWLKPKGDLLKELEHVAVPFGSVLKGTMFADDYEKEKVKIHIDNLNLLYVAFTRAEEGLFVYGGLPKDHDKLSYMQDLLHKVLSEDPVLSKNFDGRVFISGELEKTRRKAPESAFSIVTMPRYLSNDWRAKLVIKRQGSEFFEESPSEKRKRINRGITMHSILSRIQYADEAETALSSWFQEHPLLPEEETAVREDVLSMVAHPQIGPWFGKEWEVKNEALVLLPGGGMKRIDRLMIGKKGTVVVDYKTGAIKEADREQVQQYVQVLAAMGYPSVKGYLLYLQDRQITEVVNNATLGLF